MHDLSADLRAASALLDALPAATAGEAVARARDRLERDLLPRTTGGGPQLICGVVGPNNAGKSALFNALVGRVVSPSLATGGATRRLVGAAHPALADRLAADGGVARFRVRRVLADAPQGLAQACESSDDPAECLLCDAPRLPEGLLLIDTPDFDSILAANRRASEAFLAVCDLAVVVVTRHSYQNREVVEFLERWLEHRRPWVLVYNEAPDPETTAAHAEKLASDLGSPPLSVFRCEFDLEVQRGERALRATRLGDDGGGLDELLFDLGEARQIKARALDASLGQLVDELREVAAALARDAGSAAACLERASSRARELGGRIAEVAMPAQPFLEAFSSVLDRRGSRFDRGLRGGVRNAGQRVLGLLRGMRLARRAPESPPEERLVALAREALDTHWPTFFEELARDLGEEQRVPERAELPAELRAALDRALAPARLDEARAQASGALDRLDGLAAFREQCEQLVERALDERGYDWDMQLVADLLTVAPMAVAALIVVKTGGLGADLGVAGGGAVTSMLTERYARLLGAPLMRDVRRTWTELRARELEEPLADAALAGERTRLAEGVERGAHAAERLRELAGRIAEERT